MCSSRWKNVRFSSQYVYCQDDDVQWTLSHSDAALPEFKADLATTMTESPSGLSFRTIKFTKFKNKRLYVKLRVLSTPTCWRLLRLKSECSGTSFSSLSPAIFLFKQRQRMCRILTCCQSTQLQRIKIQNLQDSRKELRWSKLQQRKSHSLPRQNSNRTSAHWVEDVIRLNFAGSCKLPKPSATPTCCMQEMMSYLHRQLLTSTTNLSIKARFARQIITRPTLGSSKVATQRQIITRPTLGRSKVATQRQSPKCDPTWTTAPLTTIAHSVSQSQVYGRPDGFSTNDGKKNFDSQRKRERNHQWQRGYQGKHFEPDFRRAQGNYPRHEEDKFWGRKHWKQAVKKLLHWQHCDKHLECYVTFKWVLNLATTLIITSNVHQLTRGAIFWVLSKTTGSSARAMDSWLRLRISIMTKTCILSNARKLSVRIKSCSKSTTSLLALTERLCNL